MKKHKLGNSDMEFTEIGLGCMSLTPIYGVPDPEKSIATVHKAIDLGINHLDSSDAYAAGKNEELLNKALSGGKRDQIFLASKFGQIRHEKGMDIRGDKEYVQQACEASLKRLGVDTIDLYYQHRVDPDTPIEETVEAMAKLVEQGKVRYLGLSEASAETVRKAHAVHPITAVQTEYSLWTRFPEQDLIPTCRDLGIAYIAYAPMGRGFLTGTIESMDDLAEKDGRRGHPRFQQENIDKNKALLDMAKKMAADKNCTLAQLAIAWVNAQGDDIFPIFGTSNPDHVEENVNAANVSLSRDELVQLAEAIPEDQVQGTRYPAGHMPMLQL